MGGFGDVAVLRRAAIPHRAQRGTAIARSQGLEGVRTRYELGAVELLCVTSRRWVGCVLASAASSLESLACSRCPPQPLA